MSPVFSDTESLVDSERSQPASDIESGQKDEDTDMEALRPDVLDASHAAGSITHPTEVWRKLLFTCVAHRWGYGRCPAFWYTLNFAYNHCYDLHRFHRAIVDVQEREGDTWTPEPVDNSTEARSFSLRLGG